MKTTLLALSITLGLGAISAQAATATLSNHAGVATTTVNHPAVVVPEGTFTFTQSASNAITSPNTVECYNSTSNITRDNHFYRRFDLDGSFSATGIVNITSVDFGVETATFTGGTQVVTVNIYAIANAATMTNANLGAAVGTATVNVPDQSLTILNVPVTGAINALTSDLVVEVVPVDGGTTANNTFFLGSNTAGSINPVGAASYLRSDACGATQPTAYTALGAGFPNVHLVIIAHASSLPVTLQEYTID